MTNSSERKLLQPKKKKTIVDLFKLHKSTNRGSKFHSIRNNEWKQKGAI
jgi:hypothetical protein